MASWDILFCDVEVQREIELQGNDRGAAELAELIWVRLGSLPTGLPAAQSRWSPSPGGWRRGRRSSPGWSDNRRYAAVRRSEETARRPGRPAPAQTISNEVATGLNTNRREMFMKCASAVAVDQPREGALAPCAGAPGFFFFCVVGVEGTAPAAPSAPAMLIFAPSLSRSVPSVTNRVSDGQTGQDGGVSFRRSGPR